MRYLVLRMTVVLLFLLVSTPLLAQEETPAGKTVPGFGLAVAGIAIGMAITASLCGLAQGRAIDSACTGVSRNPGSGGRILIFLFGGLAFIEVLTLYTWVGLIFVLGRALILKI